MKERTPVATAVLSSYGSYPLDAYFQEKPDAEAFFRGWLRAMPKDDTPASLYVHVPFCYKLCWFCGCHTKITSRTPPLAEYGDLLESEIQLLRHAAGRGKKIDRIFWGGGSPTLLAPATFQKLMQALRRNFDVQPKSQIAIEIDPRTLSEALMATYVREGLTQATFGVQDFDEKVMEAVNRPQPFSTVYQALTLARDYGLEVAGFDLMVGLPHQTADTTRFMAEKVLLLAPDRIALFTYAHMPELKKHMRLIQPEFLPPPEKVREYFEIAAHIFRQAGYIQIGADHFVKAGDALAKALANKTLFRNLQGYLEKPYTYEFGVGLSAISRLPQGYVRGAAHMSQYRDHIEKGRLPVSKLTPLTPDDALRADIIQNLMCYQSADLPSICARHGFPASHIQSSLNGLAALANQEPACSIANGCLTLENRQDTVSVCAAFDAYKNP